MELEGAVFGHAAYPASRSSLKGDDHRQPLIEAEEQLKNLGIPDSTKAFVNTSRLTGLVVSSEGEHLYNNIARFALENFRWLITLQEVVSFLTLTLDDNFIEIPAICSELLLRSL